MAENQTLSLLAYKVAPRIFDISSNLLNISIRDQIVRAHHLVNDLIATEVIRAGEELLVIGASVAGLTCALAASSQGIRVTIVEKMPEPLMRFKDVQKRLVGPFMYEWPACFSHSQKFPTDATSVLHPWFVADPNSILRFEDISPSTPGNLYQNWMKQLAKLPLKQTGNIKLFVDIDDVTIAHFARSWRTIPFWRGTLKARGTPWFLQTGKKGVPGTFSANPQYIILAAGFSNEKSTSTTSPSFWSNDKLTDPHAGLIPPCKPHIVIAGGGDGALQDCLRALLRTDGRKKVVTPLDVISHIRAVEPVLLRTAENEVLAAEHQHQLALTWARSAEEEDRLYAVLDATHKAIAQRLAESPKVRKLVKELARTDVASVVLVVNKSFLSKAYALNRFLIHVLAKVLSYKGTGRANYHAFARLGLATGWAYHEYRPSLNQVVVKKEIASSLGRYFDCDVFVSRIGMEAPPASQLLGITVSDIKNRVLLSRIAQPFAPGAHGELMVTKTALAKI